MNPQLTCSKRLWLHSSVGRASHRYREVTGSNPVEVLIFFFSGFFTQLHKLRSLRRSFLHFQFTMYCTFIVVISENRYLLILTENYAALRIIQQHLLKTSEDAVVIFGSSFPNDQEYTQVKWTTGI